MKLIIPSDPELQREIINKYTGCGTLVIDGIIVFVGMFICDEPVGKCYTEKKRFHMTNDKLFEYDGYVIKGTNIMHGKGKLYYNDNLVYSGSFKNDVYHGYGKSYEDGKLKYSGNFSYGVPHGKMSMYMYRSIKGCEKVSVIVGTCINGRFEGDACLCTMDTETSNVTDDTSEQSVDNVFCKNGYIVRIVSRSRQYVHDDEIEIIDFHEMNIECKIHLY